MATQSGSIELCRFLLQTTSLFHEDSTLRAALWASLDQAETNLNVSLMEALYSLFVKDYGLSLNPNTVAMSNGLVPGYHVLYRTEAAGRLIMASQPISLLDLTPTQRFSEIVGFFGLPADTFMAQLCQENSGDPATSTDSDGKTALHWAAAHFGEWSFRCDRNLPYLLDSSDPLDRSESYMKLASRLVAMGADVHALWHSGIETKDPRMTKDTEVDPFISFLGGLFVNSWQHNWKLTTLSHAVSSWGEMLMEGGCSLPEYIATENVSLRQLRYSVYDDKYRELRVLGLVLNGESKLALEVVNVARVPIYTLQPRYVSGAWPLALPSLLPDAITWDPWQCDEIDGFRWFHSGNVKITSALYQVKATECRNDSDQSFRQARQQLFDKSQDDHGIYAGIITREAKAHQTRTDTKPRIYTRTLRRRAVSVPCFTTIPQDEQWTPYWTSRSGLYTCFHKCLFDSRWAHSHRSFRRCMQWHSRDVISKDIHSVEPGEIGWVRWLLSSEDHVPQARRYAERFCPNKLHKVEETLERATDRARMAMGPKRWEDVSGA
jgi:hypothetical protein